MSSRLAPLIKMHRWQLNEKRRRLVELETLAAGTQRRIEALDAELAAEAREAEASPESRRTFPIYVEAARERRQKLEETLATITAEMAEAQAAISEAFQELKKYELAEEGRNRRELEERARRERLRLDEIALQGYRRRSGA
jgi:flagellar export protein FliJ